MIETPFGIDQFNTLIAPFFSTSGWGSLEVMFGIILLFAILIVRSSIPLYLTSSFVPVIIKRVSQFGLYLQGILATLIIVDGYSFINGTNTSTPHVFAIFLMLSILCIKSSQLTKAYNILIKEKKFRDDIRKGWFV